MVINICGVDEAGRGPVMGPLVVAGVKLNESDLIKLDELNLRDSKMCTPKRRERLAKELKNICQIQIEMLSADEIDKLRDERTLNVIEADLFAKVILKLKPVDKAFVDAADTNEVTFQENIMVNLDFQPELISRHKADSIYAIVSAASIIAKTTRDAEVEKIRTEIGQEIGSGYPADEVTRNFLTNWIKKHKSLPPHTRSSWKTVKRIIKDNRFKMTTINEYCEESK
jgi:ribonuclease HII